MSWSSRSPRCGHSASAARAACIKTCCAAAATAPSFTAARRCRRTWARPTACCSASLTGSLWTSTGCCKNTAHFGLLRSSRQCCILYLCKYVYKSADNWTYWIISLGPTAFGGINQVVPNIAIGLASNSICVSLTLLGGCNLEFSTTLVRNRDQQSDF